jgi:hypothetical protein
VNLGFIFLLVMDVRRHVRIISKHPRQNGHFLKWKKDGRKEKEGKVRRADGRVLGRTHGQYLLKP